jgi:serine phosphatase RsbU (regulator of sigma subunit)/anti-sigma regulatory factor (Ser/Thr protein kinase)
VRIAEVTAWGTTAIIFLVLNVGGLQGTQYFGGLALVGCLALWFFLLFRILLPRAQGDHSVTIITWASVAVNLVLACVIYGILRGEVPSAQLVFVPMIVGTGLLGSLAETLVLSVLAVVGYWETAQLTGGPPSVLALLFNACIFVLSGWVAAILARELRAHYTAEQEEHKVAVAVRQRLVAVLDAVDEAVVFTDRHGVVGALNRRATELFSLDSAEFEGESAAHLRRTIAKLTGDPEEFVEEFQQLLDEPDKELRMDVEQILPVRRRLRLHSAPMRDESGNVVGRIDVYTDVTEGVRRAEEIARLYEEARKTAESYQRALLPDSVPTLPRVNIVAHYVPSAGDRAVCGDFYDFVPLARGRVGLVLGDVVGAGPRAASDAALARYTFRSFSSELVTPDRLLQWMNGHLLTHLAPDRFVRMLVCALDPERAVVEYANAGHTTPAVYRCKSGEAEWLEESGVALGVEAGVEYKSGRVELHPGDMLVSYTDGVTEAIRHGHPFGRWRLEELIKTYGKGTPGELVQAVRRAVEAWNDASSLRDDLALVVCQVVPDTAVDEPTRELVLPNEPARIRDIRAFVAAFLADLRAPVDDSAEVLLAVGEAAANATRYGRRPQGRSEIRVRCAIDEGELEVAVADDGPGFDVDAAAGNGPPDPFASGGRGLFLMRSLMESAEIRSSPEGTTVLLRRRLPVPEHAGPRERDT